MAALAHTSAARPRFVPRPDQYGSLSAIASGRYKRSLKIWHRQAGKDICDWNLMTQMARKKVANYGYIFPEFNQGRRALWNKISDDGLRIVDYVPPEWVDRRNEQEMSLWHTNGSQQQIFGAADVDRLRGFSPFGVVISEYSVCKPTVLPVLLPILARNGGWLEVNTTPLGRNHAWELLQLAKASPDEWYVEIHTIDDTFNLDGSPVISQAAVASMRKAGMSEEFIQQELYCSFSGVMTGSILAAWIDQAEKDGRITDLPILGGVPVDTYWDIGFRDQTVIWFVQAVGEWFHVVDYLAASGVGIDWYWNALKDKRYVYRHHKWPHDGAQGEWGSGMTRVEIAEGLGMSVQVVPKIANGQSSEIADGIAAMRRILPQCKFDKTRCAAGLNGLRTYRYDYNEESRTFSQRPVHDWASHDADGFRTFANSAAGPVLGGGGKKPPPLRLPTGPYAHMGA